MHAELSPGRPARPDVEETLRAKNDELHEEVRQLREMLTPTVFFPLRWKLTPSETKMLSALMARAPIFRTKAEIIDSTRGVDDYIPQEKSVDVLVCNLRRKIIADAITIDTKWGVGYGMTKEVADRLRALCAAEAKGEDTTPNHSVILIKGAANWRGAALEHCGRITCPNQLRTLVSMLHREGRKRWPQMVQEDEDAFLRSVLR